MSCSIKCGMLRDAVNLQLSRQLQMRLQYARLKVDHGWVCRPVLRVTNTKHSSCLFRAKTKSKRSREFIFPPCTSPRNEVIYIAFTGCYYAERPAFIYKCWHESASITTTLQIRFIQSDSEPCEPECQPGRNDAYYLACWNFLPFTNLQGAPAEFGRRKPYIISVSSWFPRFPRRR